VVSDGQADFADGLAKVTGEWKENISALCKLCFIKHWQNMNRMFRIAIFAVPLNVKLKYAL